VPPILVSDLVEDAVTAEGALETFPFRAELTLSITRSTSFRSYVERLLQRTRVIYNTCLLDTTLAFKYGSCLFNKSSITREAREVTVMFRKGINLLLNFPALYIQFEHTHTRSSYLSYSSNSAGGSYLIPIFFPFILIPNK
jgi:hypothetical protein